MFTKNTDGFSVVGLAACAPKRAPGFRIDFGGVGSATSAKAAGFFQHSHSDSSVVLPASMESDVAGFKRWGVQDRRYSTGGGFVWRMILPSTI